MGLRSSDGGARGHRNLVEGVGDAVHDPVKINPGETLDSFGSDVAGA